MSSSADAACPMTAAGIPGARCNGAGILVGRRVAAWSTCEPAHSRARANDVDVRSLRLRRADFTFKLTIGIIATVRCSHPEGTT